MAVSIKLCRCSSTPATSRATKAATSSSASIPVVRDEQQDIRATIREDKLI